MGTYATSTLVFEEYEEVIVSVALFVVYNYIVRIDAGYVDRENNTYSP